MNNLVSIIVPVYNVEKYIKKCLESIIGQTYSNLEIILVDDGSLDNSGKICDAYSLIDNRIRVIHKKNGGLSDARNCGIDAARGKFLAFIDSDDMVDSTFIEVLYGLLMKYNAEISQVSFIRVYEDGSDKEYSCGTEQEKVYTNIQMLNALYVNDTGPNAIVAWNKLYRSTLFDFVRFPLGRINEDEGTMYKVIYNSEKIVVSSRKLYFYLQRENSIMRSGFGERSFHIVELLEERSRFFLSNSLCELFEKNQIYYLRILAEIYVNGKRTRFDKKQLLEIKSKFLKVCKDSVKFKYISKSNEIDLIIARHSIYIFKMKNALKYKLINGLKRIKYIFKRFLEGYSITHQILIFFQSFSFCEYLRHLRELKEIRRGISRIHKNHGMAIIFISTPSHGNLGDQAIVYSQYLFFESIGHKERIFEINDYQYDLFKFHIRKYVRSSDLIVIDGGGNLGTLWRVPENRILSIILSFRKNRIVIFPQSVYFSNDQFGKDEITKIARIFNGHPRLYLMLRESKSYCFIKNTVSRNVFFTPDIVLFNENTHSEFEERRCLLLMQRSDHESTSFEGPQKVADYISSLTNLPIKVIDNIVTKVVSIEEREVELQRQLSICAGARVMVTDRLHGMIFASVTDTPCVVFDNLNNKISGVYKDWLINNKRILFISDVNNLNFDDISRFVYESINANTYVDLADEFNCIKELIVNFLDSTVC